MRPIGKPIRPESGVARFDFSDDGRVVESADGDGTVRLWDSSTGKSVGKPMKSDPPAGVTTMALSHDGRLLAAGYWGYFDYPLRVFDTDTGDLVASINLRSVARAAAFSPDGRIVASGNDDGTIVLRDLSDGTLLGAPLTGHQGAVRGLKFSPDGTQLLSASDDHTLRLWPVSARSPDAARDALCAKITHDMSHEQWNTMVSPTIGYITACPDLPEAEYSG